MRITTWNMQGGTQQQYLGTLIQQNQPDVICLQESGNMTNLLANTTPIIGFPNSLKGTYNYGSNYYDVVFWFNTVDLTSRNCLAIMSRITISASGIKAPVAVLPPVYQPGNPRSLPWMTLNQAGNFITIYSYHAPSAGTANASGYNNVQIGAINVLAAVGTWSVVGDFNADPTDGTFVLPPAGAVVRGNNPTQQGGKILDYSVTNAGAAYTFVVSDNLLGASDHFPQNFDF